MLASCNFFAVPPDAINSRPYSNSPLANSTNPVLSETLSIAERKNCKKMRQTIVKLMPTINESMRT